MNCLKDSIDKSNSFYISSLNLIYEDNSFSNVRNVFYQQNEWQWFHSKYVTIVTWPLNMQITPLFIVQCKIIIL
jgi:hypothetical protein